MTRSNNCNEANTCCDKKCCEFIIFKCFLNEDFYDTCYRYVEISTFIKDSFDFTTGSTGKIIIPPQTLKGFIGNIYIPVENITNNIVYYTFNTKDDVNIDCTYYNYKIDTPIPLNNKCVYKLYIINQQPSPPLTPPPTPLPTPLPTPKYKYK